MHRILRSRVGSNLVLIAASGTVPVAALHLLSGEGTAPISGQGHLLFMAIGSAVAALASIALMWRGARTRDSRAVISGGAFAAMSLLLTIHGLATPGVLLGPNGLVALAGGVALPVGGALLALAAVPRLRRPERIAPVAGPLGAGLVLLVIAGGLALLHPGRVPALPEPGDATAVVFLVAGMAFFLSIALRAVRTYVLTRRHADLLVVVGIVWLGFALVPVLLLAPGSWVWWTGHILELSGIALVGIPVALDVHRGRPSRPLSGDLPAADLVAAEEAFLGPRVHALLQSLNRKDTSTEKHTRRVAQWAVAIGERLGLAPGRLREIAIGGLLHDIGKLSVPDAILGKPGALTEEEMAVIREHPRWGDELLAELGYDERIRRMVAGHHERLDGSGYPRALRGEELDLETRLLALADVWDALVSPRVYRPAWSEDRAMAHLLEGSGTSFDPRCVAALEEIVAARAQARAPQRASRSLPGPAVARAVLAAFQGLRL